MRRTNMKYTPSINIAQTTFNPTGYIVTQNALGVIGNIVDSFNAVFTTDYYSIFYR